MPSPLYDISLDCKSIDLEQLHGDPVHAVDASIVVLDARSEDLFDAVAKFDSGLLFIRVFVDFTENFNENLSGNGRVLLD